MAEITQLPQPEPPEFLFSYHERDRVVIQGRRIPGLTGKRLEDGSVTLVVDGRFSVDFPASVAIDAAWLIANALAVGAGYPHLGAPDKTMPFAPLVSELPEKS